MTFSEEEIQELLKAWFAISLAFTIAQNGLGGPAFLTFFLISALTVGVAFLLHEIAHKFVAQMYGCFAEFRSFTLGLILAVLMSFTGFIFAAPGAVVISGIVSGEENGKIAAAGPLTNIILAILFWFLGQFFGFNMIFQSGFRINAWLALFNLIPFWELDGLKVMNWNTGVWLGLIAISGVLTFLL